MSLKVLASPAGSDPQANPYISQLYDQLGPHVRVREFTRRALLERPDVVHVHWPEFLIRSESRARMGFDVLKVLTLLWLARRRGAVLVWTGHDLEPHEARHPRLLRLYQRGFLAMVDHVINLAHSAEDLLRRRYPELGGVPMSTVRHGHYRDVYPTVGDRAAARAELGLPADACVLLMAGQLREYKNAPELIRTVLASPHLSLVVAGAPHSPSIAEDIRRAAGDAARVKLILRHLSGDELATLHTAADVVVLPYRQGSALHSGAAHLALSMDRPVVLAGSPVTAELQDLVGRSWVHLHDGTAVDAVRQAETALRQVRPRQAPTEALAWPELASRTLAVYHRACRARRPGRVVARRSTRLEA
jgi:beta-1,4-mannosyltransferase